jgi:hypothetical protein
MFELLNTRCQRNFYRPAGITASFVLSVLILGLAPCGNAAPGNSATESTAPAQALSHFAVADLDGDTKPDFATVQVGQSNALDARYRIRFQLSTGSQQSIDLTAAAGGLEIRSRDVNGDTFPDVIVTTSWTNRPVALLLNDGRGNFMPSDPSIYPGAFTNFESCWTVSADQIERASAALLTRYLSGDCEGGGVTSPLNETRLQVVHSSIVVTLSSAISFLGRAPPFYSVPL